MDEHLLNGRDAEGRFVTRRVEEGSRDEALRIARETLGLRDVVFQAADADVPPSRRPDGPGLPSWADTILIRILPERVAVYLIAAKHLYVQGRWKRLAAAAFLAFRLWDSRPLTWLDGLIALYLLWPAVIATTARINREEIDLFGKLTESVEWGRWEEALSLADRLEGSQFAPHDLAFLRARALTGLGRADEALALVAPFKDGGAMPEWLYHRQLADVHAAAGRPEDVRAALERAVELAPDNPTMLIDLGRFLVRNGHGLLRARDLLDRARERVMSDFQIPYALALEGRIAREEGRPRESVDLLKDAAGRLAAFRHAGPLVEASLDDLDAELALSLAAAGEPDAALRLARWAAPRLRARGDARSLDRLRSSLGPAFDD